MLHAREEEEEEGRERRRMTAKVDYGSANTSNTNGLLRAALNAMWHWHNGRKKKSGAEWRGESVEMKRGQREGDRERTERVTCKFGGHESLNLLKDFDPADPERERERESGSPRGHMLCL